MYWKKTGRIFDPESRGLMQWFDLESRGFSHAQLPTPIILNDKLRVYYSARDRDNRSYTFCTDFDPETLRMPPSIATPVLEPGPPGAFDDCGAMASCIVEHDDSLYLYYIGWNVSTTVPYRNTIGLAISNDGGYNFEKMCGPILARSYWDPYMVASPFTIRRNGVSWMWYLSCLGWEEVDGTLEPSYNIKVATSVSNLFWSSNDIAIPLESDYAIASPSVVYWGNKWRMWYSYRGKEGYRDNPATAYHIGYAEAEDIGGPWTRKDELSGLLPVDPSNGSWESIMQCYPAVYEYDGRLHMLYNGNGFGATGFGHAILEED